MRNRGPYANPMEGSPKKHQHRLIGLLAMACVAFVSAPARADSSKGLVMVSVMVVESCQVETTPSYDRDVLDLKMRCSSTASPRVRLMDRSQPLAAVGTFTLPRSQVAMTDTGRALNIEF
jgi:hypothetical protein